MGDHWRKQSDYANRHWEAFTWEDINAASVFNFWLGYSVGFVSTILLALLGMWTLGWVG